MTRPAPKQVLLIDDDAKYRGLLLKFFKSEFPDAGITAYIPSKSGRPGPRFDWSAFDVLIMEYHLCEGENGLDWLRTFKNDVAKFPATIVLTASGSEDIAVRALRYGAHDYLRKQNLTSERLADSISDAFNVRARQSDATHSLTINASRFSKSFFYGQFKLAFDEAEKGKNRALILIRVDGYDALQKTLGVLGTDAIARYLGKLGTEIFNVKNFRPRATRFTDSSIAILAGEYKAQNDLERLLKALCARVAGAPPSFDGAPINITLSIGAVVIVSRAPGVAGLLEQAEAAVAEAARTDGNSIEVTTSAASPEGGSNTAERARIFDAREAVKQNRLQASFRAHMRVSEKRPDVRLTELFQITPRFVAHNGETLAASSVLHEQRDESLSRLVDRWKIRECVGRLVSKDFPETHTTGFYVELGEASCTDVKLAGWIGSLIEHIGSPRKLNEVCLAVPADVFMRHLKPLTAFFEHSRRQHGFLFALNDAEDPELLRVCVAQFPFDLIVLSYPRLKKAFADKSIGGSMREFIESASKRNALIVARGIGDAGDLTDVITEGADFVEGEFIASEQDEVEAAVGIESVQIKS